MKTSLFVAAVLAGCAVAKVESGKCPEFASNKDGAFEAKAMSGLWYEYVWGEGYGDGYGYDCATWTVLADTDDKFLVYNHMQWLETEKSDFIKFELSF